MYPCFRATRHISHLCKCYVLNFCTIAQRIAFFIYVLIFCRHLVLNLAQKVRFQFCLVLGQKAPGFDSSNQNLMPKTNCSLIYPCTFVQNTQLSQDLTLRWFMKTFYRLSSFNK